MGQTPNIKLRWTVTNCKIEINFQKVKPKKTHSRTEMGLLASKGDFNTTWISEWT